MKRIHTTGILILAALLTTIYVLSSSGRFHIVDEVSMYAMTESLALRGAVDTNAIAWTQWVNSPGEVLGSFGPNGQVYSKKGPALSVLAVPWFQLVHGLSGIGVQVGQLQATLLLHAILTAWTAVLLWLVASRLGYGPRTGMLLGLLFGLTTIAWPYAKQFFGEPLSALSLLGCFYGILAWRKTGRTRWLLVAGISGGIAIATVNAHVLLVGILLAWWVVDWWLRGRPYGTRSFVHGLIALAIPLVVAGGLLAAYNFARFGSFFDTGYHFDTGEGFTNPILSGLWGLLFSPYRGVFLHTPLLLASLVGFYFFFKRHRSEAIVIAVLSAALVLLYSAWWMWWGGFAWGPRFLVPLTPFWVLLIAPLIRSVDVPAPAPVAGPAAAKAAPAWHLPPQPLVTPMLTPAAAAAGVAGATAEIPGADLAAASAAPSTAAKVSTEATAEATAETTTEATNEAATGTTTAPSAAQAVTGIDAGQAGSEQGNGQASALAAPTAPAAPAVPAVTRRERIMLWSVLALAAISFLVQLGAISMNFVNYEILLRQKYPTDWSNPLAYGPPAQSLTALLDSPVFGQFKLMRNGFTANTDLAWLWADGHVLWVVLVIGAAALITLISMLLIWWVAGSDAGEGGWRFSGQTLAVICLAPLVLMGAWAGEVGRDPIYGVNGEGYRAIVADMCKQANSTDVFVNVAPTAYQIPMNWMPGACKVGVPTFGYAVGSAKQPQAQQVLKTLLNQHDRLFFVTYGVQPNDPDNTVEQWLGANAFKASDNWFGDYRLVQYATPLRLSSVQPKQVNQALIGRQAEQVTIESVRAPSIAPAGEPIPIEISFHLEAPTNQNLRWFVQLWSGQNIPLAMLDTGPDDNYTPFSSLEARKTLVEKAGLLVPANTPPGEYRLIAGLYNPDQQGARLVTVAGPDWVELGNVRVVRGE